MKILFIACALILTACGDRKDDGIPPIYKECAAKGGGMIHGVCVPSIPMTGDPKYNK